jgi:hypothetical protein
VVFTRPQSRQEVAEALHQRREVLRRQMTPAEQRLLAPTKAQIMEMGSVLWRVTYAHTQDDRTAYDLAETWFAAQSPELADSLALPFDQILALGGARWADCGFPQIVVGHRYAAALMATHIPTEVLPQVRPPWPAFMVEVPDAMLPIVAENGQEITIRRVLVHHVRTEERGETWQFLAMTDGATTIWRHGIDTKELALSELTGTGTWEGCTFAIPLDQGVDGRTNQLVGKLIAAVCLAMSDPSNVKAHPSHGSVGSVGSVGRRGKEPKARTFKLGKEIVVDCRQALDDFIHDRGKRKGASPTVQTLVRGHWKPKLSERMGYPVWVEPYWRGPLDAPILSRPIALKEPE